MPILEEIAEEYKNKSVVLYAVNLMERNDEVRSYLESQGLNISVVMDRDGKVGNDYFAYAIPMTVVVGKDGTVQVVHVGVSPSLKENMTKELNALLAGKTLA